MCRVSDFPSALTEWQTREVQPSNAVHIAEIRIADTIEAKINEKHQVTAQEVREALILRRDVRAGWEDHPDYGVRLIAFGRTYQGRPILAVLLPLNWNDPGEGSWILKTARSPRA